MKLTAKEAIRNRLKGASTPLAVFELQIFGVSENGAASRLPEMALAGEVVGTYRKGKKYKEWQLIKRGSGVMVAQSAVARQDRVQIPHPTDLEVKFDGNQRVF